MSEDKIEPEKSSKKTGKGKIATISSCVIWVLSIVLSFTVPPTSPCIWLPDATLLVGFIPLLFVWSPSWPWIVFGICNLGIGFLLLLFSNIPDGPFPKELVPGKHHLVQYHPCWSWMIMGALCTLYGIGRFIKNITKMVIEKKRS